MTLDEVKEMLQEDNIPYEISEFENEEEYWQHVALFPYTQNAKPCKVIALIIYSKNGKKNIELQFNESGGAFYFEDLRFGEHSYELFDCQEDFLQQSLIDEINRVLANSVIVIVANDLKKQKWLGDAIFGKKENDDFGLPDFEKTMKRINKKKGFFVKLFQSKMQYEIYDWNTYECIVK